MKKILIEALEIIDALRDLLVAYRIGRRPKEKSLDTIQGIDDFLKRAREQI